MKKDRHVAVFLLLLIFCGVIFYFFHAGHFSKSLQLKEALAAYVKGEKAKTMKEREEAFNRALSLYTHIEEKTHPTFGNGKLYYNIANAYFQLGQYPWAILYYYRALALMPRSAKAWHNLDMALDKLGLAKEEGEFGFSRLFPFHNYLSIPERLQLFFGWAMLTFLLSSLYLWYRRGWQKKMAILFSIAAGVILLSLGYSQYLSPVEGVIVRSTILYRDAGEQYARVREKPILSGSKVEVLNVLREGHWLKIMTPEGDLGYIPQNAIRLI